jgi:hypothetical protein
MIPGLMSSRRSEAPGHHPGTWHGDMWIPNQMVIWALGNRYVWPGDSFGGFSRGALVVSLVIFVLVVPPIPGFEALFNGRQGPGLRHG